MYLVTNLAVVDMVCGGVFAYVRFYFQGAICNLWKWHLNEVGASILNIFSMLCLAASFTNIAIIALERVHATFFPFKHRVLKKWVYRFVIAVVWVTSGLLAIAPWLVTQFEKVDYSSYLYYAFILIFLLIICVSYTSIVIKVCCGAQPQHHGATSRERKLTMTLLIVTVVSLLLCLPFVISIYVDRVISQSLSFSVRFHLSEAFAVLFFANSLVNPILYTMRIPEYRSALLALFCKRPQQPRQVAVFALRDM